MIVETRDEGAVLWLRPSGAGALDGRFAQAARAEIEHRLEGHTAVVLSLSGVLAVDSGGMSGLVGLLKLARRRSARFVLIDVPPAALATFTVTRMSAVLEVAADEAQARELLVAAASPTSARH